jgi:hypothetical protein
MPNQEVCAPGREWGVGDADQVESRWTAGADGNAGECCHYLEGSKGMLH